MTMAIALKSGKHTSARVASRLRRQVRGRKKLSEIIRREVSRRET